MPIETNDTSINGGNYSGNTSSIVSGLAPTTTIGFQKYYDYSLSESPDPIASSTIFRQRKRLSPTEKTLTEVRDRLSSSASSTSSLCKQPVEKTLAEVRDRFTSSASSTSSLGVLSSKTLNALSSELIKTSPEKMRSCGDKYDKTKKLNDSIRSLGLDFDDNHDISVPEVKINQKELDDMMMNISGFSGSAAGFDESFDHQNVSPHIYRQNHPETGDFGQNCTRQNIIPNQNLKSTTDDRDILNVSYFTTKRNQSFGENSLSWNKTLKENFSDVNGQEFVAMGEKGIFEFMDHEEAENKIKHQFIQDAVIQPNATGYDTSTWSVATTSDDMRVKRPSWIETNASSVSVTTFMQSASCPLGNLGEKASVRPNFGLAIVSPVHKLPISLVDESTSKDKRTTIETDVNLERTIDDDLVSENDDDGSTTVSSIKSYQCLANVSNDVSRQLPIQQNALPSFRENNSNSAVANKSCNDTATVLSLSRLGKLLSDMSVSANESSLAAIILNANRDLAKQKAARLANKTAVVIQPRSSTSIDKKSDNIQVSDVSRNEMKENAPKSETSEIFRKRKHDSSTRKSLAKLFVASKSDSANRTPLSSEKMTSFVTTPKQNDALAPSNRLLSSDKSRSLGTEIVLKQKQTSLSGGAFSMSPTIFTNRAVLGFGCVAVSHSATQFVTLQNRSNDEILHLKVCIKHDSNNFQILNADSDGCILLHPNEKFPLKILFKPSAVKFYHDRILLSSASDVQKFGIPVKGYGGCAKLMITNLAAPKSSRFDVTLKYFDGKHSPIKLILKNFGSTAAFFKSFVYADVYCSTLAKCNIVTVNPPCGVVAESSQMLVDIAYSGPMPESGSGSSFLACVGLRWGEELTRRRLREYERASNRPVFIKMTKFTDVFHGENEVPCLYDPNDVHQRSLPEDARFFVGHLREYQIYLNAQDYFLEDCSKSFFPLRLDQSINGAGDV